MSIGNYNSKVGSVRYTADLDDRFTVFLSANRASKDRYTDTVYETYFRCQYGIKVDDLRDGRGNLAPHRHKFVEDPTLALENGAIEGGIHFHNDDIQEASLEAGYQRSWSQLHRTDNGIAAQNNTKLGGRYHQVRFRGYNLACHGSQVSGTRSVRNLQAEGLSDGMFKNELLQCEYHLGLGKLELLPGVYKTKSSTDWAILGGESHTIEVNGVGLKAEYSTEKFRYIAGARQDTYKLTSKSQDSYHLGITYLLDPTRMVRILTSRGFRYPTFRESFVEVQSNLTKTVATPAHKRVKVDSSEIGYKEVIDNGFFEIRLGQDTRTDFNSFLLSFDPTTFAFELYYQLDDFRIQRRFFEARVGYEAMQTKGELSLLTQSVRRLGRSKYDSAERTDVRDETSPGWVAHLKLIRSFTQDFSSTLLVRAQDKQKRVYRSVTDAPGTESNVSEIKTMAIADLNLNYKIGSTTTTYLKLATIATAKSPGSFHGDYLEKTYEVGLYASL